MFSNVSRNSCHSWDNVEKYARARQTTDDNIIRRMRYACCITKATNVHSEYIILPVFPQRQCLRKSAWMLRLYIHCASLFQFPSEDNKGWTNIGSLTQAKHNNILTKQSCSYICISRSYKNALMTWDPYIHQEWLRQPEMLALLIKLPVCQDDVVTGTVVAVAPDGEDGVSSDVHLWVLHLSTRRRWCGLHRVLSLQFDGEVAGCSAWNRASVVILMGERERF